MKVAGIIAEYNPFHTGHAYHIDMTRRLTGADYIIAVMSGDYVQRGEPACTDKYFRARMALLGGADVVIELPVLYATASAEYFATSGVKLLDQLKCVDYLSFGSEHASLEEYAPFVHILTEEQGEYQKLLQSFLKKGYSFPRARSYALQKQLKETMEEEDIESFLKEPNHILGLEYLKALQRLHSPIRPAAVIRRGASYHDHVLRDDISSASAIRRALVRQKYVKPAGVRYGSPQSGSGVAEHCLEELQPDLEEVQADIKKSCDEPEEACDRKCIQRLWLALGEHASSFLNHIKEGEYVLWDELMPLLDYEILMNGWFQSCLMEDTDSAPGIEPELANRIRKQYQAGVTFKQLIHLLHSRNRTDSALKRALLKILLHLDRLKIPERAIDLAVPYGRVLGFRKEASGLLKQMRECSRIPIIQRPAEGYTYFRKGSSSWKIYHKDIQAADLYDQIIARKTGRAPVSELTRQQIII